MVVEREPDIRRDYFCTACRELVENPDKHHREDHDEDDRFSFDIFPVVEEQDGEYIAKADDMGHFSPHVWIDSEGMDVCAECGAAKFAVED